PRPATCRVPSAPARQRRPPCAASARGWGTGVGRPGIVRAPAGAVRRLARRGTSRATYASVWPLWCVRRCRSRQRLPSIWGPYALLLPLQPDERRGSPSLWGDGELHEVLSLLHASAPQEERQMVLEGAPTGSTDVILDLQVFSG